MAAAALAAFLLWGARESRPGRSEAELGTVTTRREERRTVILADGSRVDLNAQTGIVVNLRSNLRRVRMTRGEAMFSIAKDAAHPFTVETPEGTVRDLGTVFDVLVEGSGRLQVTVLEGQVQVQRQKASAVAALPVPVSLSAGEQLSVRENAAQVRALPPLAMEGVAAWPRGESVFEGVPLQEALAEYSRFHGRVITADPAVQMLRLGGRFNLDDLDGFLSALEKALPVRVVRESDGSVEVCAR